ncbi:YfhE family protein [Aquibacillus rhizosphaerae]|uniref:YfhE family protein n=1 Tax=Aquibacillus rhizosphaerae TaxID=3051431 RepID=A0ABT7L2P6_9BACI|nr:YfhE family protein [Aquibacillus sp. LR5S19]MDL4840128.1 YfhE family protein [Aquibacillus sp. LR5S19]
MARKTQYQPTKKVGAELSDAQEVHYNKDFKKADIAAGYRKQRLNRMNEEN